MSRPYTVSFENVAISALQDIFNLASGSGKVFEVHEVGLSQKTLTAWEAVRITHRKLTATVTNGSGGSTPTPAKHLTGDSAAVVSARANDVTTQASSSGTNVVIRPHMWPILQEYSYIPADWGDRMIFGPSENYVLKLEAAPSASMTVSGFVVFHETN